MATCTIFKNFTIPVEDRALLLIANDIASDKYKTEVEHIRSLKAQGKHAEAQEAKKQLPAFTPSATFTERRLLPNLKSYSGFVHLDFDKLTPDQLETAKSIIATIPYTFLCFVSPSGNGLKVFVEVTTGPEHHELAFQQVLDYYENATGLRADPSVKDIPRLCFITYDPSRIKNINNTKYPVDVPGAAPIAEPNSPLSILTPVKPFVQEPDDLDAMLIFNQQIQFTNQKLSYETGNRNNYIYRLASNCNRAGLPRDTCYNLLSGRFDLQPREIQTAVASAYLHHSHEFNTKQAKPSKAAMHENEDQPMPTLPENIFTSLPEFLRQITDVASSPEERDILLLGSLVTLSVAFPSLYGRYADKLVNANLYLFITAKASAGKGILIHCRKLVEQIHLKCREEAKQLEREYEAALQQYNLNKANGTTGEKPAKPLQKMLFIPANNSSTGFFEILNDSNNRGIVFETEGDTLSSAFESDYGNYSDGFRKAFHHEPITYYRRTNKEYVEILRPSLSAMLSGTPRQIQILIPNPENGLFSRFMFYVMNMKHEWKDVFACKTENGLDDYFEALGNQFYSFYQTLETLPEINFSLKPDHQERFNAFFSEIQAHYLAIQEEDIVSSVRRLGLSAYRMMMIFSALRMMETGEIPANMVCSETDFTNTLAIIKVLVNHSNLVFNQIAQESLKPKPKCRKESLLHNLPEHFNRQIYLEVATKLSIPDSSAQRYMKHFELAGLVVHEGHDNYCKPLPAA